MSALDRQAHARAVVARAGCDALVTADPGTVWWLTGVAVEVETGPSPFGLPPIAVVTADDEAAVLVVSADHVPGAVSAPYRAVVYEGFTAGPLRGHALGRAAVADLVAGRSVAVDGTPPVPVDAAADVRERLLEARAVKDAEEVAALRTAIRVADAGQRQLRAAALPGRSEIEIFGEVRAAMERAAVARVPVLADLVSGPGTAGGGGPPGDRILTESDVVLCDLAPRVDGVWGDSCATVAVGGAPASVLRRTHARVREALERALDFARPGVSAGALDEAVRAGLDYAHHTGHGLGGAYYEYPRIVPGADTLLRPGMVIALEPAHYEAAFGVRLEHVVLITADGAEDLSGHDIAL